MSLTDLPGILMSDATGLSPRQASFVLQQIAPLIHDHAAVLTEVICLREVLAAYRHALKEVNDALFAEDTMITLQAIATIIQAMDDMEAKLRKNPETAGVAAVE